MISKLAFFAIALYNAAFAFDAPQYDRTREPYPDTRIIGVECNKKSGTLEVGYFTAYNLPTKTMDLWSTFDLKKNKKDSDYVESVHKIVRKCKIGSSQYVVTIRAVPGNWNLNGECGGDTYGGAKIVKNGAVVFDKDFEGCGAEEMITTVRITGSAERPVITKKSRY